jgi:alpha-L-fucosidase
MTPSFEPPTGLLSPQLSVRSAQFSTRWEDIDRQRVQAVAITLANILPGSYATSSGASIDSQYEISVSGEGVSTVAPAFVYRLVPADQTRVDVLVLNNNTGAGNATVTVKDGSGNIVGTSDGWPIVPLRTEWTADADVLTTHETPTWWNQAKYGIL